jgi:hypothetical protein
MLYSSLRPDPDGEKLDSIFNENEKGCRGGVLVTIRKKRRPPLETAFFNKIPVFPG